MDGSIKITRQFKQVFEPYCVMLKEVKGGEGAPTKIFLERKALKM